jgi:tetratricopeptide (TPR) repeat protein
MVCLFLSAVVHLASGQDLTFDATQQRAYQLALSLHPAQALQALGDENSIANMYIASLAETIELLVTEDYSKFASYEERFLKRLDRNVKSAPRDFQFLQAELRLHWAFVYLKFGHELDAALQLRESYKIAESCRQKFADYVPILRTAGLLEIIVGSIPEKYGWVLSLLNMSGSVPGGLADLETIGASKSVLATEGRLLHALVQGFMLEECSPALADMSSMLKEQKRNPLIVFLSASLAIKNSESARALELLKTLSDSTSGVPLYYADYLKGEAYLHKGDYLNSILSYRWFINHQTGQNYIKDAYFKIGLCYWLNGNENDALELFKEARNKGKEATEADKSAARALSEPNPPNAALSRIRYYTDGGYYKEAEKMISSLSEKDFTNRKDITEYYYRKARLAHKMNKPEAVELYKKAIDMTGMETWYFAPNACLELGYIFRSRNDLPRAADYFERALSYKRHEYKNSIDSKARSALAQIGRI